MSGVTVPVEVVNRALQGLGSLDLAKAWAMLKSGDVRQELVVGEEAAEFLSAFWPEAKYAEDVMRLAGFVIALRDAGVWSPGQPTDLSMSRAAGRPGGTPSMHGPVTLSPGGTLEDPYNLDGRQA